MGTLGTLKKIQEGKNMTEKQLEMYFDKELEKRKCLAWKFISTGRAGVPDRIVILPWGKVVFVELKALGKKLRTIQQLRFKQLRKQNVDVWLIDRKEKVAEFISAYGLDSYE